MKVVIGRPDNEGVGIRRLGLNQRHAVLGLHPYALRPLVLHLLQPAVVLVLVWSCMMYRFCLLCETAVNISIVVIYEIRRVHQKIMFRWIDIDIVLLLMLFVEPC